MHVYEICFETCDLQIDWLIDWLIDCLVFYVVSAVFQPYKGDDLQYMPGMTSIDDKTFTSYLKDYIHIKLRGGGGSGGGVHD